jgi:hypothetical protein
VNNVKNEKVKITYEQIKKFTRIFNNILSFKSYNKKGDKNENFSN